MLFRSAWRNLLFPAINPKFGWVTGLTYAMAGWWWQSGGLGMVLGPLLIVAGFITFTDTHSTWYKRIGGTLHAAAHLLAAAGLAYGARALVTAAGPLTTPGPFAEGPSWQTLATGLALFGGGWVVGSFLMGLYLLISLNVFGRHSNEAFSALRLEDFKHFIRMHIGLDGRLRIFPMGIERVPRAWRPVPHAAPHEAQLEPEDPRATTPASIEPAIVVPPRPV